MQLVKKIFAITTLLIANAFASDLNLIIKKGNVKVRPVNKDSVIMDTSLELNTLDYIATNQNSISGITSSERVIMQLGENSCLMIDKNDKTGWKKFYLTKGSLRVYTGDTPFVIKTPTAEIVTFDGICDIHVLKGVSLIAPRKGKGGMIYCKDSVDGVTIDKIAHVDQNGKLNYQPILLAKYSFLMGDNITNEITESESLTESYRNDFFKRLNIGWTSQNEKEIPIEIRDILVHKLNFTSELIALESSVKIYDHYSEQGEIVRKGSKLLFAQKLFNSQNSNELIPIALHKYFIKSELTDVFKTKLDIANNALNRLSPIQKNFVLHFFRQEMIGKLRPKHRIKNGLKVSFKEILVYNSNVTQTPDDQVTVSDQDDISANSSINVNYTARPGNKGTLSTTFKYSELGYFKKLFQTREYSNLGLKLKNKFTFKKKARLSNLTPSVEYKMDFLNTVQGKYLAFETLDTQLEFIFKPIRGSGQLSDLALFFTSIGAEDRTYKGNKSQKLDALGKKKDTLTPKLILFFMSMKSYSHFSSKFTTVLNYRNSISKSADLDYTNLRFDSSFSFIFPNWTFTPSFALSQRDQDNYRTSTRTDKVYEYSIGAKRPIFNNKCNFGLTLKSITQNSNITNLNYSNNQVSALFNYKF